VFQTAHVEAVRQAHEVIEQVQREAARRQVAEAHMQEENEGVHSIPHSQGIRTEADQGRKGAQTGVGSDREAEQEEDGTLEEGAPPPETPAAPAERHLDLLA